MTSIAEEWQLYKQMCVVTDSPELEEAFYAGACVVMARAMASQPIGDVGLLDAKAELESFADMMLIRSKQ